MAVAIVPKAGQTLTEEQVLTYCRENIAAYKVPAVVHVLTDALPRNPAGKLLKAQLRSAFIATRQA